MRALAAVFLVLALPVFADDDLEKKVAELVKGLGADEYEAREAAQKELSRLGQDALPLMQKALEATDDAEVRFRLAAVVDLLSRPRWFADVGAAVEEATSSGRPIFVVSADGPINEATSPEGLWLRNVTIADAGLVAELNRKFVLVWWNGRPPFGGAQIKESAEPMVEGNGSIAFYFCNSRGIVRHCLMGWWKPKRLREEAERAAGFLKASDASEALKVRRVAQEEIASEAKKLAEAHPEEMSKPDAESEVKREVALLGKLSAAYAASETEIGEPIASHLMQRLREQIQQPGPGVIRRR